MIFTAPVAAPKQDTFVDVPLTRSGAVGPVNKRLPVAVQPFASTTVTLYVPIGRPEISSLVDPVFQLIKYGPTPPEMVMSMDPVAPLKQLIPVPTKLIANGFAGTKIV